MEQMIENFKKGELTIHCVAEHEADQLMEILNNQKIKWESGESVFKNHKWDRYEDQTYYAFSETGIVFGDLPELYGRTTISFEEFLTTSKSNKEKVLEMIGVKIGDELSIAAGLFDPYHFNENYDLVDILGQNRNEWVWEMVRGGVPFSKIPKDPNAEIKECIKLLSGKLLL